MRYFAFLVSLLATTGLTLLLAWENPMGQPLPAVGRFFSPFTGFWQNAAQRDDVVLPQEGFTYLKAPVQVVMDERLVPHIFAEHETDAIFVQGYLMGRYRLWQMDFAMRAACGRLAEILGEKALERDIGQRRKGMLWAARNALTAWEKSPEEMALLNAFTEGVNAYIRSLKPAQWPLEFKLLGYAPEAWKPLHSAIMVKSMAETLCSGNSDLQTTNALAFWGKELFETLYPEYNPKQSPVIPAGTPWNFQPVLPAPDSSSPVLIGDLFRLKPLAGSPPGIGSNNWAVSGTKTASGSPILCNDPHLTLSLPSIWYEMQIHTPNYSAYGVGIPGLPGIVIGFNENFAWGVTNVGHDVLDWYRISWLDDAQIRYLLDDQPQDARLEEEVIEVRGRKMPHIEKVKYTVWGPVVYEQANSPYQGLAMHWIAHEVQQEKPFYEIGTFIRLGKAKTWEDYTAALHNYESPAQNFIMANRLGDVAIRVNGYFPLKSKGQGRYILDGSNSANEWQGFIPMDQVPAVRNPPRGFVSSANQHSTDPSYPYYYNSNSFDDYRGRIINRTLEQKNRLTADDMKALQNENRSILAEEATPLLLKLLDRSKLSTQEQAYIAWLEQWDFTFAAQAKAPSVFVEWLKETHKQAFDEIYTLPDSIPMLRPENWRLLDLLEQTPDHAVFDVKSTPAKETAREVVTAAFQTVIKAWHSKFAAAEYTWATHKSTDIMHLARIPAFSRMDLPVGGYGEAPNAIKETTGPSWRVIVELGKELKAWGIYPGGQSGHPSSRFYDNRIDRWMKGEYDELNVMPNPKASGSQAVLFQLAFTPKSQ